MIHFNEETHQYFDGDTELISVTTLMAKHRLAPDYSGVSDEVLRRAADRGKAVHKEIEEFIKKRELGFTGECSAFVDYWHEYIEKGTERSEFIVYNDICAGTADLLFKEIDGKWVIADIKTTSVLHKDAISWQLSIYNAMCGWKAKKGMAFHCRDGACRPVEIQFKPKEEVERLFECERKGILYTITDLASAAQMETIIAVQQEIARLDAMKKDAEMRLDSLKQMLIEKMEESAVKSFENDILKITYISPKTTMRIDAKRLEAELPDVAAAYKTETVSKPSIRITIKKEKRDE